MARWSGAEWHRCPGSEPAIRPTQVIYHTAVNPDLDSLQDYFCSGRSGGIESHFGVGGKWGSSLDEDGEARQWRDTEEQADANRTANRRPDGTGAISVETTDNAPDFAKDIEPWTPKQLATLVRLGLWALDRHGVPARICRSPDDPGFGWHAMWDDTRFELADGTTPWTPKRGKECPGPTRIAQLKTIVFPAIFAGRDLDEETDDMTPAEAKLLTDTAAAVKRIEAVLFQGHERQNNPIDNLYGNALKVHEALVVPGTTSAEESFNILFGRVRNIEGLVEQILAALPKSETFPGEP